MSDQAVIATVVAAAAAVVLAAIVARTVIALRRPRRARWRIRVDRNGDDDRPC